MEKGMFEQKFCPPCYCDFKFHFSLITRSLCLLVFLSAFTVCNEYAEYAAQVCRIYHNIAQQCGALTGISRMPVIPETKPLHRMYNKKITNSKFVHSTPLQLVLDFPLQSIKHLKYWVNQRKSRTNSHLLPPGSRLAKQNFNTKSNLLNQISK